MTDGQTPVKTLPSISVAGGKEGLIIVAACPVSISSSLASHPSCWRLCSVGVLEYMANIANFWFAVTV